jgi:hypothetical protein
MASEAGKGDKRRQGDDKLFDANYDNIKFVNDSNVTNEVSHSYTIKSWIEHHGAKVEPKNYKLEFEKWLEWRLKVDSGETRIAPMVIGDIQPYRSMHTGEMIMSRSNHKAHLKQHKLVEIGNEVQKSKTPVEQIDWKARSKERKKIIAEVSHGYRPVSRTA